MKIIADANIPLVVEAFGPVGEVVALPAERITRDAVRQADALLVRSVTRVDAALLEGSAVRFVATATIGFDHIDQAHLARRGIAWAYAPGSNARSVAEYVLAALAVLAERGGYGMLGRRLGIVGCGNVGGRLARMAEALGMTVLRNDPPLARKTGPSRASGSSDAPRYVPIEALADADVVTFHVPLEHQGPDATYHMINSRLLARLKRGVTVINSSRGSVAETAALKAAVDGGQIGALVLDVWEGEPNIDLDLLARTALATPHIAGYSYDGKVNGTRMVLESLCRHFGLRREWDPGPLLPPAPVPRVHVPAGLGIEKVLRRAMAAAYDMEADDRRLRAVAGQPPERRGQYFSDLRKHYPVRREFPQTTAEFETPDEAAMAALRALDFPVAARGNRRKDVP